jgi:hypothetical protein
VHPRSLRQVGQGRGCATRGAQQRGAPHAGLRGGAPAARQLQSRGMWRRTKAGEGPRRALALAVAGAALLVCLGLLLGQPFKQGVVHAWGGGGGEWEIGMQQDRIDEATTQTAACSAE